jgi:pyridoxal 5'-phosphate synthase pdxS subunit
MQIGVEGIFVGSGIFNSENPEKTADAIVQATTHFEDADLLAEVSKGLGAAMRGEEVSKINPEERLEKRGW